MPSITINFDKPVVVLPIEDYEDLLETIDILSSPSLDKDIEEARKALREGKTVPWDEFKKEFLSEN